MVFKEVTRVESKEVIRQWQAGRSMRGIARATGLSRVTVRKYLRAAEQAGVVREGEPPTEEQLARLVPLNVAGPRQVVVPTETVLGPWAEQIATWLQEERLLLTRVQELLAQAGCTVSYTSLRRFVARRGWGRRSQTTVRMAETAPGAVAEVDFGRLGQLWDAEQGRQRVVWALVVVLAYSRHCFVWPLFQPQLPDRIAGLEQAWTYVGGVPRYVVLDNMPPAIAGADALQPTLTRGFLAYAQHRSFIADPTRARHPKDKPRVERSVPYVRERFFKGGTFAGLADLRDQARQWCVQVAGQRVHGTTRKLPLVVFQAKEQAALLPWDGEPYAVPDWRSATVHPDHHIACQYALYSVPATRCPPGSKDEVRLEQHLIHIYHRGQLVKVHPRQPRGGRATDPADYPEELSHYTTRAPEGVKRRAAALGPAVGVFAERLLAGPLPWAKLRQGHKLLRLGERYTPERLAAACAKALTVDLIDVRRLERILVQALEAEAIPQETVAIAPPPGRFARPGSAFARTTGIPFPQEGARHAAD